MIVQLNWRGSGLQGLGAPFVAVREVSAHRVDDEVKSRGRRGRDGKL